MKSFVAVLRGPDHVFEFANAAYRELAGSRDVVGKRRADVFAGLNAQSFVEAADRAYNTGQTVFLRDTIALFDDVSLDKPKTRRLDVSYEPMRGADGKVSGLFVQGRDVTAIGAHPLEQRAGKAGLETLTDHELLTLFLYHGTLDSDSAERAEHLLKRFRDLSGVLSASLPSLSQIVPNTQQNVASSVPSSAAIHLKIAREIGRRILFKKIAARPLLSNSPALRTYLRALLAWEPRERFLVLFLDNSMRLIACEAMTEGTIAHAPIYRREVVRRAVELSASALVLVHNHPSGSRTISPSDITTTADIERAAAVLDIRLIDHLVVAGDDIISLADEKLMPPAERRYG